MQPLVLGPNCSQAPGCWGALLEVTRNGRVITVYAVAGAAIFQRYEAQAQLVEHPLEPFATSTWSNLAIVVDDSGISLERDGVSVGMVAPFPLDTSPTFVKVGIPQVNASMANWKVRYDDVRIVALP